MIRLLATARAAVVTAAWLFGGPAILILIGGQPLPRRFPTGGQVYAWLEDPLNPAYHEETARTVAWVIWLVAAIMIGTTLLRRQHRRTVRWATIVSRLPPPMQAFAATILGSVAVTGSATVATPAAASAATAHPTLDRLPVPASPTPASPQDQGNLATPAGATRPATSAHGHSATPNGSGDAAGGFCRVVTGDTLWDLAGEHLGDPHRWREIYQLNRSRPQANGDALSDPDDIDVGWVLALPAGHHDGQSAKPPAPQNPRPSVRPTQPPASPDTALTPPTNPATVAPPAATRPDPHAISPAASAPTSSSTTPSPPASQAAAPTAGPDHDDPAPSAHPRDGIDLPGGWITPGLGAGLLAATAMVWWHRRHRYQPAVITEPYLQDTDLVPPLAAMTRIRTSLRRTAPEALDEPAATAPTVREYQNATNKPQLPPVGPSGADLAGAADLPLTTGLGLTGPGALDAARGLLVATLAAGTDDDPDAKARALIPAATLATLLGPSALDLGHLDQLTVTDTDTEAITALEEEIIARSRLIADAQVADVRTLRDTDVHAEPIPQLLLIAELPNPAWTPRLITAVRLGQAVDIGAAIIGDWPTGTTLTVADDGTTGTEPDRLTVLDTTTAIDALALLREAHGGPVRTEAPAPPSGDNAVVPQSGQVPHANHDAEQPEPAPGPPAAPPTAVIQQGRLPVAVRILGRPAVLDADGQPSPGIRAKALELLVYLAVNRHGADLSDIMEALYPDAPLRRASERLSTVVADLRKHIRRAAALPTDTTATPRKRPEPIPNTGSRYHLDPDVVHVDWWTVLDQYEAVAAATDPGQQLRHLTAALDAAGPLDDGENYDWTDTDREVVRRHRIKLHVHAAALLADTDPHRSWLLLEQGCDIDPLSDELARTTMRAAATLADADAIRHRLTTLRNALDAHGLDINDDTEALARDLLRQLHPARTSD